MLPIDHDMEETVLLDHVRSTIIVEERISLIVQNSRTNCKATATSMATTMGGAEDSAAAAAAAAAAAVLWFEVVALFLLSVERVVEKEVVVVEEEISSSISFMSSSSRISSSSSFSTTDMLCNEFSNSTIVDGTAPPTNELLLPPTLGMKMDERRTS